MEAAFFVWAAAVTVGVVVADIRVSMACKRLGDHPQEPEDACNVREACRNCPKEGDAPLPCGGAESVSPVNPERPWRPNVGCSMSVRPSHAANQSNGVRRTGKDEVA